MGQGHGALDGLPGIVAGPDHDGQRIGMGRGKAGADQARNHRLNADPAQRVTPF